MLSTLKEGAFVFIRRMPLLVEAKQGFIVIFRCHLLSPVIVPV
jgi:hypothetical protein